MVAFYVMRIKSGKMVLEDVPARWRAAVEKKLVKDPAVERG